MPSRYQLVTGGLGYNVLSGADPDMDRIINALAARSSGDEFSLENGGRRFVSGQDAAEAQIQEAVRRSGTVLSYDDAMKAREYPIGFVSLLVPAGATVDVITQPQVVFRGERLIVPSDIAGQFTVNDVRVGKNSQFASVGPIPARTFDEQGVGVRLRMDTAQISQQIAINVTNIGGAPATFRAALIGTAVE